MPIGSPAAADGPVAPLPVDGRAAGAVAAATAARAEAESVALGAAGVGTTLEVGLGVGVLGNALIVGAGVSGAARGVPVGTADGFGVGVGMGPVQPSPPTMGPPLGTSGSGVSEPRNVWAVTAVSGPGAQGTPSISAIVTKRYPRAR